MPIFQYRRRLEDKKDKHDFGGYLFLIHTGPELVYILIAMAQPE